MSVCNDIGYSFGYFPQGVEICYVCRLVEDAALSVSRMHIGVHIGVVGEHQRESQNAYNNPQSAVATPVRLEERPREERVGVTTERAQDCGNLAEVKSSEVFEMRVANFFRCAKQQKST